MKKFEISLLISLPQPRITLLVVLAGYSLISLYGLYRRKLQKRDSHFMIPAQNDSSSQDFRDASVFFSRNQERFTAHEQLCLYGLYKQATVGDIPREGSECFDSSTRRTLMHGAWADLVGVSASDAERRYVDLIETHCPFWREGAGESLEGSWDKVGSMPVEAIGQDSVEKDESAIGKLCELCAQGKMERVEAALASDPDLVHASDKDGMTCLHWASDRGHADIVRALIALNCDVNQQDDCGNTALHIAVMADQKDIVRLLLDAKADTSIVNTDGDSASYLIRKEFPKLIAL